MRPMTVLYLNTNPRNRLTDQAGYATHMAGTIHGFEADGHRVVTLLAAEGEGVAHARDAYRGMRRRIPVGAARLLRDGWEMVHDRRFFRACLARAGGAGADFVYERANAFHRGGQRLARALGIPHVLEINDPLRESITVTFSALKPIAVRREEKLMRGAALVVVGSESLRGHYAKRGFDARRILVLYPVADERAFSPGVDGRAVRARYALDGAPVAGFVGSMAPWHGVEIFQAALSRLYAGGVRGMLVGGAREGVPASTREPDPPDGRLIRVGRVPYAEVPSHVAAMDICVIANATWYGSPTKLFEYAAMEKAVVAPRFAPIQEIIEDGRTGLLFAPGDVDGMAAAITRLARDPGLRRRLGQELRKSVQERFSWKGNTRQVIERILR